MNFANSCLQGSVIFFKDDYSLVGIDFPNVSARPSQARTDVPRPGPGAGSRGIKLRPHAAIFPPRGPSAFDERPSRPFGLRSPLKGTIATKATSCQVARGLTQDTISSSYKPFQTIKIIIRDFIKASFTRKEIPIKIIIKAGYITISFFHVCLKRRATKNLPT